MALARFSVGFIVALHIGVTACTTTSGSDRVRIVDVPLATVQSDIEFSLIGASQAYISCAGKRTCLSDAAPAESESFDQEVARIASALQMAALRLYPDLAWCSPKAVGGCFDVQVVDSDEPGSSSSASGRIALNASLERWQSGDAVLAFVLGREMGHVIARHHQESYSVNIVASIVLNLLIPGSGVLKSLVCTVGARLAAGSNREAQAREADAIAFKLLKGAGFRLRDVSRSLLVVPTLGDVNAWSKGFGRSAIMLNAEAETAETKVASAVRKSSILISAE